MKPRSPRNSFKERPGFGERDSRWGVEVGRFGHVQLLPNARAVRIHGPSFGSRDAPAVVARACVRAAIHVPALRGFRCGALRRYAETINLFGPRSPGTRARPLERHRASPTCARRRVSRASRHGRPSPSLRPTAHDSDFFREIGQLRVVSRRFFADSRSKDESRGPAPTPDANHPLLKLLDVPFSDRSFGRTHASRRTSRGRGFLHDRRARLPLCDRQLSSQDGRTCRPNHA